METETYKNAKLILERFDPEAKRKAVSDVWILVLSVCLLGLYSKSVFVVSDFCLFCLLLCCRSWSQLRCVLR